MLNFDFLKKGLWIVSPQHFVYNFSRKMFLILYILLIKFQYLIAFTSWDIEQMCMAIVC